MPYLFKLSRRVARLRTHSLLLATATILGACESTDPALSGPSPSHPSFATATGLPAGVTDLAVAAMTDTSATLTFTEVDDGTGAPASYDIRVAPTPLVWGGTVPSVKRGTCATPVTGTAIGAKRTCTVLGLTTGSAYDFQLVEYRGTLMVNAVFGPLSNVASGTARTPVAPVAPTAPGTVNDLKVAAATDTVITLSFTEVTDGSGQPASYDVRYVSGATLTWGGTTPSVSRGSCGTPLTGMAIGAKRSCTVVGLIASTTYSFELVAYRGTLKVNAVFGGLSNIATGTTAAVAPAAVAAVSVSPGTASAVVGSTQQLGTTLKDASGNVLTGRSVAWTSSNAAVATVSGSGLVTAVAPGSATITATSGTIAGTAAVTVTAPTLTAPGAVSDLNVAGATDTVVTLSFTEVNDGSGHPASYDVRYVSGSTLSWGGSTPSVTRGTCATPLTGTTIGAKRSCTVLGLTAATTYSFELVAYRGTLKVNAVFGGLSNVASGTTTTSSGGGGGGGGASGGGQGTSYFNSDFENGTLGDLSVYPGSSGTCTVTTEAARTGTRAAKCITTPSLAAEGALWYTWGSKPGEPANPALSNPNGYYQKFSVMYAPGSLANVYNGGTDAQFKLLLNRSDWHYGFDGEWFMTSWGVNYGTWPPVIENNGDNCSGMHWNWPFALQEGVWYDITTWYKRDPTTHTGHAKMWVNGVLLMDTDVMPPAWGTSASPGGYSCLGSDNAANQQQFEVGATYTHSTVGTFTVYVDDVQAANFPIGAAAAALAAGRP